VFAVFREFLFSAGEIACVDAQVALNLGIALVARFEKSKRFKLEFASVLSSSLCHCIPPIVASCTIRLFSCPLFRGNIKASASF
jgi:hypothetical protein